MVALVTAKRSWFKICLIILINHLVIYVNSMTSEQAKECPYKAFAILQLFLDF